MKKEMQVAGHNDAELVAKSLAGNQEAFRQIVERHQTLVCSLAYCATGSVSQSEDLAQETFITAWKDLAELREPSKLRSWLCAILRFLISKQFRRQDREPAHAAEPMEAMDQSAARIRCHPITPSPTKNKRFSGVRSNRSRRFIVNRSYFLPRATIHCRPSRSNWNCPRTR